MNQIICTVTLAGLMIPFEVLSQAAGSLEDSPDAGQEEHIASSADAGPETPETTAETIDYFARDTLRINAVVCPFKSKIDYKPGELACGLLQVPENREDPNSRFTELHFVKISSTWDEETAADDDKSGLAPGKRKDPVVYLTGGPGVKVAYYLKRLKKHKILKHRDLYVLEQRGVGFSGDFCPFFSTRKPEAADVKTFEAHLKAGLQDGIDCTANAKAAGVDLTGYNSIENARDVKALRRALGIEKWNVWGISYGSFLGQAYLKQDPEGIRAAVLDAIVPLNVRDDPAMWRTVKWYIRDLEKLDEICRTQPACADRYPNLADRIRRAVKSVSGNPIVVEVEDKEAYPSGKARFFTDLTAFLPFYFLYEQSAYPWLPGAIYTFAEAVENRDETLFKALALVGGQVMDMSDGMAMAIYCLDGDSLAQVAAAELDFKEYPILSAAAGTLESYERRVQRCIEMGMAPRNAEEYAPVETDIPTLIVEGEMDPITPPPPAKAIVPGFKNGTYVEFPYAGHGPTRSVECAGDMLNKFFDKPTDKPDLSCVEEMEPPQFYAPLFTTSVGPRLMGMALEDKKLLVGPGLWAGLSFLVSLLAFFVLTIAPVGRRIDKREAPATSWARPAVWLAAVFAVLSVGILAGAMAVTYEASPGLLLFGLVSWARLGAIASLLSGLLGIAGVVLTVRAQIRQKLPVGTLLGFLLTGLGTASLSAFLVTFDLGVF